MDINEKLDAAMKGITLSDGVLSTEKFEEYVQTVTEPSVVLKDARFIEMNSNKTDIDRIGFSERILKPGKALTDADASDADVGTNQLSSEEFVAYTFLNDKDARRSIEKKTKFEETLMQIFGSRTYVDMEETFFLGDTASTDQNLKSFDGWLKLAGKKVSKGFTGSEDVTDVFDAMLAKLPKKYLKNRGEFAFYVSYELEDAYRTYLGSRETNGGHGALVNDVELKYKGIPVKHVYVLDNEVKNKALLTHPLNLVWGLFHEVTIETERDAKKRRTDFVLTTEIACHYEDQNAAVSFKETAGS